MGGSVIYFVGIYLFLIFLKVWVCFVMLWEL